MKRKPLHTVVETPEFRRTVNGLLNEEELGDLVDFLASEPDAGDRMTGTGGARKLRWPGKGKGKRGGCRVITFYSGPPVPVFLLAAFGKGARINLSKAERNALKTVLSDVVANYRAGVRSHVQSRRKHSSRSA